MNVVKLVTLEHTLERLLCHVLKNMEGGLGLRDGQAWTHSPASLEVTAAMPLLPLSPEIAAAGEMQTTSKQGPCGFALSLQHGGPSWTGSWEGGVPQAAVTFCVMGHRAGERTRGRLRVKEGQRVLTPKDLSLHPAKGLRRPRKGQSSSPSAKGAQAEEIRFIFLLTAVINVAFNHITYY